MEIKNLILIIIAVFHFFVAILVILKNYNNKINWFYGLLLISVVGWSISLSMSRELTDPLIRLTWSRSSYYFSAFIALFILLFSFYYPFKNKVIGLYKNIFIVSSFLLILVILIKGNLLITGLESKPWGYDVTYGNMWYWIYSAYFLIFLIWSFINFFKKYFKNEGIIKKQLSVIIAGLGLAGIFGIIFDLILPYFGNWKLNWLGPYFTIFVLFSISYLIFYKPSKTV